MDRHSRASEIFLAASELPSEKRAAYLNEACRDDAALRADVEKLLAHDREDSFLEPLQLQAERAKPPEIIGDFRIVKEIGRGGMGTVYEAEQVSLQRKVALKILPAYLSISDDAVRKFQREAEAGGRQSHPGIVAVHAIGEHEGIHYIAQELVGDGSTLNDRLEELRTTGDRPPGYFREVAQLISDVTDALQHAHDSGVIHRDIKPSNVLLAGEWSPKVTDFGLAKVEDALALSRTGEFAGTPYYMSPEQAMSRPFGIDSRTDVYSLGVTLYEMLTLKRPFEGHTSHEILKKIMLIDPVDPRKTNPKVPRDLSVICLRAMEKSPAKRYQSMAGFGDDLRRFLSGDAIMAKPVGLGTRVWKRVKRNPMVSAAIGVALAAIIAFILYVLLWSYPQIRYEKKVAEAEKERAVAAEEESDRQREIAETRLAEITRLADVKRLFDLEQEAEELWPADPKNIPALESWLKKAEKLAARLDGHRAILAALREEAQPDDQERIGRRGNSPPDLDLAASKPREWNFADTEIEWEHDTLAGLVSGLEDLLDKERGLRKNVRHRLDFAKTVENLSIDDHQEAWDEVIEWVANDGLYNGLELEPQLGLVPIGYDSRSGLWEFTHLFTGTPPERGWDGQLILTEETGVVFVLIPGGTFDMGAAKPSDENPFGSPNVDPDAIRAEGPVHRVDLGPFFLSKYEMTQAQWLRATGANPSFYEPGAEYSRNLITSLHPVETVSWKDCMQVLRKLDLRLPTEAEWEYAIRSGTTTVWWTGDEERSLDGAASLCDLCFNGTDELKGRAFEDWLDDGYVVHAPVGSYRPNFFGLHDVCGNVWEWCHDYYNSYEITPRDGSAHAVSLAVNLRVVRGGCWFDTTYHCRSAHRFWRDPDYQSDFLGLRPARSVRYE